MTTRVHQKGMSRRFCRTQELTVTDLFCGAGGASIGMVAAGAVIREAANHWKRAVETYATNHQEVRVRCADISQTDPSRFETTDILWASPECHVAGTLILTWEGLVPVEDVKVGDVVLTHRNRWRSVTATNSRLASTLVVGGQGHPGMELTDEHPFYVRRQVASGHKSVRTFGEPEWVEAAKLADPPPGSQARWRWATPVLGRAGGPSVPALLDRSMPIDDPEFWWLVGRWLGDGTVRTGDRGEITIVAGDHEADELWRRLQRWQPTGGRAAGDELRWRRRRVRTAWLFETNHRAFAHWLERHFGRLAHGKTIPTWAFSLSASMRTALLSGYVSADGYVGPRSTRTSTVSKSLAIGVRLLAESLGYRSSLHRRTQGGDGTIEGRAVTMRPIWTVGWENNGSGRAAFEKDGHAWSLVKSVKPGSDLVEVFTLSIEEDESYVADGIVVHNCKTHSQAAPKTRKAELFDGTKDAYVERSRVTMWDVVQFAEYHRYKAIIVENVVDIGRWALLDPWFAAMRALGYDWRVVSLNSMVAHPTPQSRDRWYVVFWQGIPAPDLEIRPACWCGTCEATVEGIQTWKRPDARWGKYHQQYTYTCGTCKGQALPWVWPAASAIDWSLPCERIGDKPLREFKNKKTGEVTVARMAPATIRRIEVGLERYGPGAIVQAAGHCFERKGYYRTWPSWQPLKTLSSTNQYGVAMPAFLMDTTNTGHDPRYDGSRLRDPREPLFTQTALAAAGLVTGMYGRSGAGAPVDGPLPTLMGTAHHGLVTPLHHGETGPSARPASDPFGTQSGRQETGLIIMGTGSIEEAKYRATTTDMPLSTIVGSAINQQLVVPNRTHGQARPADAPLPTMDTSTGGGAFIAELRGGYSTASPVTDPLAAFAASGNHHMLIEPVPFLTPYYGNSTPSPVDAPAPTVTSVDRCALVEPSIEVDDCGFRMLEPPEAGLGMGFPSTYIVGGSKRDQVRQYGQAVTPPASCVLLERVFEAMS